MRLTKLKPVLYFLSVASIFFFIASCSQDSSSPTSATSPVATAPAAAATAADPAPAPDVPPTETTSDPFSCQQVGEVKFRFSDPGFISGTGVGGLVLLEGLPAGNKVIQLTWDNGANGNQFNTFHIGEVESYQNVFEHSYSSSGNYEVKLEVSIKGTAGSCVRVREVSVGSAIGNMIVNGGFETGNLDGWTNINNGNNSCDTDFMVRSSAGGACDYIEAAPEGTHFAYTSFDGDGPQYFRLSQTFIAPSNFQSATLSWQHNCEGSIGVGADRTSKTIIAGSTVDTITLDNNGCNNGNITDWTKVTVDVTTLLKTKAGENVTLLFEQYIPEDFTDPAGYGLDDVKLIVQ